MKSVHRWLGAGASALLALGMGLQPAAAAVDTGKVSLYEQVDVPNECAKSLSGPNPGSTRMPADGAWHTLRLSRSGQVSIASVSSTGVANGRHEANAWGTTRVSLTVSGSTTWQMTPGRCPVNRYQVSADIGVPDAVAVRTSWLVINSSGRTSNATAYIGARGDRLGELLLAPGKSATRLVPPGTYSLGGGGGLEFSAPASSSGKQSATFAVSGTVALYPIGTLRKQTGKGRAFVTAGNRDCAGKRVTLALSDRTHRKARRITLTLDGKRVKVLTGRSLQRAAVRVKRIPAKSGGVIGASVVLKSGAVRKMKATSWPCA